MLIGINCTKNEVVLAETVGAKHDFSISKTTRFAISIKNSKDCADLFVNLKTLLSAIKKDCPARAAILSCSGGSFGSSAGAIKAEAIAELVCENLSIEVSYVKPQSLKFALGCSNDEKWQTKAKEMFNNEGKHKYFSKGGDGASAAAYKESS